jgi:hypothetical protein
LDEIRKNLGEEEKRWGPKRQNCMTLRPKFRRLYIWQDALIGSEDKPHALLKRLVKTEDDKRKWAEQLARTPGIADVVHKF